jgi:hypothetical protein
VSAGHKALLAGRALGTQTYICLPAGASVAWILFGPQSTFFKAHEWQLITYFLSPNPDEHDMARAAWQHSRDTGTV